MRRTMTALVCVTLTALTLTGCSLFDGDAPVPTPTRTAAAGPDGNAAQTPVPAPTPSTKPVLAVGAVAAETDVVSKSGDTRLHVRIVQRADGFFDAHLSDYRTTNPQPMSLQFRHRVAGYSDGSDPSVRGQAQWTGTDFPQTVSLADAGREPDYLRSAVLVPVPAEGDEVGDRPWAGSVLAVGTLEWDLPNPYPGLEVTMGDARPGAYGFVRDVDGTPTWYQVSHGDELITVAERFGITPAQFRWMNPYLEERRDGWLHEDATLNISPTNR